MHYFINWHRLQVLICTVALCACGVISLSANTAGSLAIQPNASASTGLYADGWIGSSFTTFIPAHEGADMLVIEGEVPDLPAFTQTGTTLQVSINGSPSRDRVVRPGRFALALPAPAGGFTLRIGASPLASLPKPDERLIATRLIKLTLLDSSTDASSIKLFPKVWLEIMGAQGIAADGWAGPSASLSLPTAHRGTLHLRLLLPAWGELPQQHLTVSNGGEAPLNFELRVGENNLAIPFSGTHPLITLNSGATITIPAPDNRSVSFLIESISLSR